MNLEALVKGILFPIRRTFKRKERILPKGKILTNGKIKGKKTTRKSKLC